MNIKFKKWFGNKAMDDSALEESPGRHDQPAEGGQATVDQAIEAMSSPERPARQRIQLGRGREKARHLFHKKRAA